jgi:TraM recognition site of TraD and TraG
MDHRKILLINLSKGLLSETDTMFLGMVLTGRLFAAAMTRATLSPSRRVPFYVYIDEFQNFTSASIGPMLAEARKYGLSLTLAHQNLAQLPKDLSEAVLANTGSRVFMRVGSPDAQILAQYVAPNFTEHDLVSLPDRYAVARLKVNNVPSPPFVLRTPPESAEAMQPPDAALIAEIVRRSRERHSQNSAHVRRGIEMRRLSYLSRLTPRAAGFEGAVLEYLTGAGVRTLNDVLPMLPEQLAKLTDLASSVQPRAAMEVMLGTLRKLSVLQKIQADPQSVEVKT